MGCRCGGYDTIPAQSGIFLSSGRPPVGLREFVTVVFRIPVAGPFLVIALRRTGLGTPPTRLAVGLHELATVASRAPHNTRTQSIQSEHPTHVFVRVCSGSFGFRRPARSQSLKVQILIAFCRTGFGTSPTPLWLIPGVVLAFFRFLLWRLYVFGAATGHGGLFCRLW